MLKSKKVAPVKKTVKKSIKKVTKKRVGRPKGSGVTKQAKTKATSKKTVKKISKKQTTKKPIKKTVKKAGKKIVKKAPVLSKSKLKKVTKSVKSVKSVKLKKKLKPGVETIKVNGEEIEYTPPKSYKIIGYCPKCSAMVGENDLESVMIFKCPDCQLRKRTKYLKETTKKVDKVRVGNREEYLRHARTLRVDSVDDTPSKTESTGKTEIFKDMLDDEE